MSQVYEELKARGLIAQCTNEEKVRDLLDNHQTTFYIGFDATADSLHVGHFLQLVVMSHDVLSISSVFSIKSISLMRLRKLRLSISSPFIAS